MVEMLPGRDAPEPTSAEVRIADLGTSPGKRTGRRRWLVVAAAAVAAALLLAAGTVLVQRTGDDRIRTRPPAGPSPSTTTVPTPPKAGQLVVSAWFGGDLGAYLLYADGRLLWVDDTGGTPGFVEQRLTPEGVERVRSEFLATGLFDDGLRGHGDPRDSTLPSTGGSCGPVFALLCVRDDGRLLRRDAWFGLSPEEQLLRDNLRTLPWSLPPTDWADQQITAYQPANYFVCFIAPPGAILDPSEALPEALKALPPRAEKLLEGREADTPTGFQGGAPCFEVTAGNARVLADELVDAFGTPTQAFESELGFAIWVDVDRPHVKRFGITFQQLLPNGDIALYYPALA
jgi:hypothetical protein